MLLVLTRAETVSPKSLKFSQCSESLRCNQIRTETLYLSQVLKSSNELLPMDEIFVPAAPQCLTFKQCHSIPDKKKLNLFGSHGWVTETEQLEQLSDGVACRNQTGTEDFECHPPLLASEPSCSWCRAGFCSESALPAYSYLVNRVVKRRMYLFSCIFGFCGFVTILLLIQELFKRPQKGKNKMCKKIFSLTTEAGQVDSNNKIFKCAFSSA